MSKIDEKLLDAQITKALYEDKDIEELVDFIEPDEELRGIMKIVQKRIDDGRPIYPGYLREILIARDKKVLGVKDYQSSFVAVEDLNLDDELSVFNGEIEDRKTKVNVVTGKDKNGKNVTLYYYQIGDGINRQQRTFNTHGDIESMHRHAFFSNGRLEYIDNALVSYQYDNQGRKKAALYQDDILGMRYYEYDRDGNISLTIQPEAVSQTIKDDEFTYTISDGFIEPSNNGYTYKSMPEIAELTPDDMRRAVSGNIPQDKRLSVLSEMDQKRKEEVLSILTAVEPVFQSLSTDVQKNEQDVRKRMDKVVTWFTGFAKRLQIDSKLAIQDSSVMSAMKSAVSKTVGRTADAQADIMTPAKDEKEYEGEDYGDK